MQLSGILKFDRLTNSPVFLMLWFTRVVHLIVLVTLILRLVVEALKSLLHLLQVLEVLRDHECACVLTPNRRVLIQIVIIDPHSMLWHDLTLKLRYECIFGLHLVIMRSLLDLELLLNIENSLLKLLSLFFHLFDLTFTRNILLNSCMNFLFVVFLLIFEFDLLLLDLWVRNLLYVLVLFDGILLLVNLLKMRLDLLVQVLILIT